VTRPVRVRIARRPGCDDLPLPSAATPGSAGFDLPAAVVTPKVIAPGDRALIPTGFSIAVTIDSDYRGEVKVILFNTGEKPFAVRRGDRIAQLVIAPVVAAQWEEVSALDSTARGSGGFGHTGHEGES
jgi:dUTP pyrophosphatase